MQRIVLTLAALSCATPVLAQDMSAECALQAEVVMELVSARTEGTEVEMAALQVGDTLSGEAEKYQSVLPMLADWVYTLPQEQLGPMVGESWNAACMSQ